MAEGKLSRWVSNADKAVLDYLAIRPLLTTSPIFRTSIEVEATQLPAIVTSASSIEAHQTSQEKTENTDTAGPNPVEARAPKSGTEVSGTSACVPTPKDVLLGRGKPTQQHPGNKWFRSIIEGRSDEYEAASKLNKTLIAEDIIRVMHRASIRFLSLNEGSWKEIDKLPARLKIASAFRFVRKRQSWFNKNLTQTKRSASLLHTMKEYRCLEAARPPPLQARPDADENANEEGRDATSGEATKMDSSDLLVPSSAVNSELSPIVYNPSSADVLFGRGQGIAQHPGNIKFRRLVSERMDKYEISRKTAKNCVSHEITNKVKDANGRFLKPLDRKGLAWKVVDDHEARLKVASAFRSNRKAVKQNKFG